MITPVYKAGKYILDLQRTVVYTRSIHYSGILYENIKKVCCYRQLDAIWVYLC